MKARRDYPIELSEHKSLGRFRPSPCAVQVSARISVVAYRSIGSMLANW
jgi:hypothetical protein